MVARSLEATRPKSAGRIGIGLCAALLFFWMTAACLSAQSVSKQKLRVLFVGNSLTFFNDLPWMLERMLKSSGVRVDRMESCSQPNYGLQDHWESRETIRKIERGRWDVVVLQQGPSATEGRPSLLEFSRRFAEVVRRGGGRPALYMVWPSAARFDDFDGVSDSYRMAAERIDGLLFPVGEAWRAAWRRDPKLELYGPDGFHPSLTATYLAALVIHQQLSGLDPTRLPPEIPTPRGPVKLDAKFAKTLQEAAAQANAAFARR